MNAQPPIISRYELNQPAGLARLDLACREWGSFYLSDHGTGEVDRLFGQARDFFSKPRAKKRQVRRTRDNPWGYFDEELTKNTLDWKEVFDFGPKRGECLPQFPTWQAGMREACEGHFRACELLSFELLSALSRNLGVDDTFLFHAFEPEHASFLRLNYYPPCPTPAAPASAGVPEVGHLGVNHHTDAGALTLLMTDEVPGLEIFLRDRWHEVPPVPGAMIVNIGDIIQVWSNDRYRSPLHRVRCKTDSSRMSIPFFFNPKESFNYEPLTAATSEEAPARYRAINFGDFRRQRANGDYSDQGEEIQIEQFQLDMSEG